MNIALDSHDLRIIQEVQGDATLSLNQLAERCGMSVPSVQRRLKKLRKHKVIEKEIAVINPQQLGPLMTFIVMVELERERLDQLDAFKRLCRQDDNVQQCYYVTGDADFALVCVARNLEEFEVLTHRLFFNNANVRRFRTSVVMDRTKVSLAQPIHCELNP